MEIATAVVCIYGRGGDFRPAHVERLVAQLRPNVPRTTKIACLTDDPAAVRGLVDWTLRLPARHLAWGWRGCWPKLSMFRWPGPLLYLDLDVTITGRLDPFLEAACCNELVICRDFWNCDPPLVNGSVIGWQGDLSFLFRDFAQDPQRNARTDGSVLQRHWSEQLYILARARQHGIDLAYWQDVLPGLLYSYKREVASGAADTSDMRICVSHGQPRPWAHDGADRMLLSRQGP